ncbi:hypothetical protein Lal_00017273 [Lupinus albus]|nr:hypothetical protein Lal_00017273 [Lupinus albus]
MVKKGMKSDMNQLFSLQKKHNHVFLKFTLSFLLVGLTCRLFISDSFNFSSLFQSHSSPLSNAIIIAQSPLVSVQTNDSVEFQRNQSQPFYKVKCDLFVGEWVHDQSGPLYTNESCHVIEDHQNCMRNGRTDSGYLYWRWNPRSCNLPKFNAKKFLDLMRNKSWAFIGDSISRNHVQSLLCILSQVQILESASPFAEVRLRLHMSSNPGISLSVCRGKAKTTYILLLSDHYDMGSNPGISLSVCRGKAKTTYILLLSDHYNMGSNPGISLSVCRVTITTWVQILESTSPFVEVEPAIEVYHDEEYRSKIWKFPSHNFTLSVIWAPFLIKADIFEDMNGVSSSEIQLYLDTLDNKWTDRYNNFDYVTIAGGKWFLKTAIYHENATITGCHYCPGKNLTELGFEHAYRKALKQVFNFITSSNHKAMVFFRTTTPDHFENGEWFSGGYCNRTVPFKEKDQEDIKDVDSMMRGIEVEEFNKGHGANLKLLDTTYISQLRPDGHPGPYREFYPFAKDMNAKVQNDCLHWCLPGPIDSWNDIVMEMLINNVI